MICYILCRGLSAEILEKLGDLEREIAVKILREHLKLNAEDTVSPWFFVEVRDVGGAGDPFCRVIVEDIPVSMPMIPTRVREDAIASTEGLISGVQRNAGARNVRVLVSFHVVPPYTSFCGLGPPT